MFSRIFVALDDPEDGPAALPHLRQIARPGASRVIVMKTAPFLETLLEMPGELSPDADGDEEAAEVYVEGFLLALQSEGIDADGFVNIGRSGLTVAAAAERVDASIVVVVAPLRPGLPRPLLSRRIDNLLHATNIPVYVVPTGKAPRGSRILIPIDPEEGPANLLPTALALARSFGRGIVFIHVLPPRSSTSLFGVTEYLNREGISAELAIRHGDPAVKLPKACAELNVGVLAIRPGILPRDASVRLLRESPVPLLMLRRPIPPAPADEGIFRITAPVSRSASVPTALWTRRTPPNPLLGVGDTE
jgi:nucleotide-binding universal stress UspA family protein